MAEARFSAERISKVSETVLLAAVHAAEEIENNISETVSAATEGVRQGLSESIEFTHNNIATAGRNMLLAGNLEQVKEDLEATGDLFAETLRRVADKSGESAKEILHELADDSQKTGSTLREKAVLASRMVAEILKELGENGVYKTREMSGDTSHAFTEESRILGNRMLVVAKSAANNVWESAKIAFYQDDNEKKRS
jgi:predicted transcriptional regulator